MSQKQVPISAIAASIADSLSEHTQSWLDSVEYSSSMEREFNIYLDPSEIGKRFEEVVRKYFPNDKDIIYRAVDFIEDKHSGQYRDEHTKYYFHPMMAAIYCAENGGDIDQFLATLLHDTLEDTDSTLTELETSFWETVANLVRLVSFTVDGEKVSDEDYYTELRKSKKALLIKAVDRLSNIYSTLFTEDINWKEWYFQRTREEVIPLISIDYPQIAQEIEDVIQYLEKNTISVRQRERISLLGDIMKKENSEDISGQVKNWAERTGKILDGVWKE